MPIPIAPLLTMAGVGLPLANTLARTLGLPEMEFLNYPGQAVRGLFAGRAGELLSGDEFLDAVLPEWGSSGAVAPSGRGGFRPSRAPGHHYGMPGGVVAGEPIAGFNDPGGFRTTREGDPSRLLAGLGIMNEGRRQIPGVGGEMDLPPEEQAATARQPRTFGLLGALAEMFTDPLNYIGGAGGLMAGRGASRALGRMATRDALAGEIQGLERIGEATGIGKTLTGQAGLDDLAALSSRGLNTAPLTSASGSQYIPEILDELPNLNLASAPWWTKSSMAGPLGRQQIPEELLTDLFATPPAIKGLKTLRQVEPAAAEFTQRIGLGNVTPEGMQVWQTPSFLTPKPIPGRGSMMVMRPEAMAKPDVTSLYEGLGLADEVSSLQPFRKQSLANMQYTDTLSDSGQYMLPKTPAELFRPDEAERLSQLNLMTDMPGAVGTLEVPGTAHIMDMPLGDVGGLIPEEIAMRQAKLSQMGKGSALIRALYKLGYR